MADTHKGLLEEFEFADKGKYPKIKQQLDCIVRKFPQAVLKVSGYGSDASKVGDHLDYISRNGALEIEDEQGNRHQGRGSTEDIIREWEVDFTPTKSDDTLHKISFVVDSTGQDRKVVYDTLKRTLKTELSGFDVRVDVSRAKKNPNRVYLRANVEAEQADTFLELLNKIRQQYFDQDKTEIKERKPRLHRNVMKVVLSSPAGTDPDRVEKAARDFAQYQFGSKEYRYLFSLHDDTGNAHVHLVVKMVNEQGKRLSTNRKDLHSWRTKWAEIARFHGIQVSASYNSERGRSVGKEPSASYHIANRNDQDTPSFYQETLEKAAKRAVIEGQYRVSESEVKGLKLNAETRKEYMDSARTLRNHADSIQNLDKKKRLNQLADLLETESRELAIPLSRVQKMIQFFDKTGGKKTKQVLSEDVLAELKSALSSIGNTGKSNVNTRIMDGPEKE